VDRPLDEAEDQRPSTWRVSDFLVIGRFAFYLLGFFRDDNKCGCVNRRWWCRPCNEVFWRLKVGVGGSLKFKRIVARSGSIRRSARLESRVSCGAGTIDRRSYSCHQASWMIKSSRNMTASEFRGGKIEAPSRVERWGRRKTLGSQSHHARRHLRPVALLIKRHWRITGLAGE
jgi:hypothetical protein